MSTTKLPSISIQQSVREQQERMHDKALIETLRKKVRELESKNRELKEEVSRLRTQLDAVTRANKRNTRALNSQANQTAKLIKANLAASKQAAKNNSHFAELTEKYADKHVDNDFLSNALKDSQNNTSNLQVSFDQLQEECASQRLANKELLRTIVTLRRDKEELQNEVNHLTFQKSCSKALQPKKE